MATPPAKKVLVVEDNELNMKLFCDLLDAFGFQTVESRDGLKAVDLARTHKPDLIIMDLHMPHLDGFEVMQALRPLLASERYLPVLIVTVVGALATWIPSRRALKIDPVVLLRTQ